MTKQQYEQQLQVLRSKRSVLREQTERMIAQAEAYEIEAMQISKQITALQNKRLDQLLGA